MQKKIIALAVAGLVSGAAFAQSNVTVYGVVDAYYGHFSSGSSNQTINAINSGGLSGWRWSSSRWLCGSERQDADQQRCQVLQHRLHPQPVEAYYGLHWLHPLQV